VDVQLCCQCFARFAVAEKVEMRKQYRQSSKIRSGRISFSALWIQRTLKYVRKKYKVKISGIEDPSTQESLLSDINEDEETLIEVESSEAIPAHTYPEPLTK